MSTASPSLTCVESQLNWYGAVLSAKNFRQLYIPPGFIHGFCVLSASAQVEYKCTDVYHKPAERSVRWNDPDIGIDWPVEDPLLSARDRDAMSFAEAREELAACAPFTGE